MTAFLRYIIHEASFILMVCFDAAVCFSLLWCAFRLVDEALGRLLLRRERHQVAGWRFFMVLAACITGFRSAPAVRLKSLFRDTLLPAKPSVLAAESYISNALAVISLLWAGYAVFRLICYIRQRRVTSKCLRCLPDMPPDAAFTAASRETGVTPVCKVWQDAKGIAVFGIRAPVMTVPEGFADKYTHNERYCLYLHELTHILRRDTLINLLTDICELVFWAFPPIVSEMRRLRDCRELQCDISVLRRKKVEPVCYGALLLREIKGANNRLLVGFSGYRYRKIKLRLDCVLGTGRALSAKRLAVYFIACALLIVQFLQPVCEMPYQRIVSVISSDGEFRSLYFEEDAPDTQDAGRLLERVYTDCAGQDIKQIVVQYPRFHYSGMFGFYLSSENETLLDEQGFPAID